MLGLLKNKNLLTIIISCIIIVMLFASSWFFRVLNKTIQNEYYAIKNDIVWLNANPHIIIVELNDESFQKIWRFPFPRSVYAQALKNLEEYQTAVVAFDILFLDPSTQKEDDIFSQAITEFPNVVLGASINGSGKVNTPFSWFKKEDYVTGFLPPIVEPSNKTVYSFPPSLRDIDGKYYEHFSLQILRSFYRYLYGNTQIFLLWKYTPYEYVFSSDISYPLSSKNSNEILINFIPPAKFSRISFNDIYDSKALQQVDKNIWLKDKIILIGPAADGLRDDFFTPNGVEYGVNIHANILNTLLSKQHMVYFDARLEWIMIFFLIVLSVSANLSSSNRVLLVSNITIVLVFWLIIPISILLWTNLILNYPSEIIFSLLLAFTSANIVKYLIEDRNKQKLNKALSEYVWSNIAEEILLEHGKVNLDGQEKNLVCFFSDIEWFTSMSENLSPNELVSFLREYLSAMTEIIMDKWWHVDKFEWDAVMALWGAFSEHTKEDYIRCCESALLQQKSLSELNKKWENKFWKKVAVRMGIHGGLAIIWNIGAIGRKMEFTALGDSVNLASRLEGVNKFYNTSICVSDIVYSKVKNDFVFRYLDEIQVKWKETPVKIYELIGTKDMVSSKQTQIYIRFIKANQYYKERNFTQALEIFTELASIGDEPSKVYLERCQQYITTPPGKEWNGVWRMMKK